MDLTGRVALVTGGAVRLGRATSLALAARGMKVVINYHKSASQAAETVRAIEQLGSEALAIQADVAQGEEVQRLVQSALTRFGRIDVLINNAAIFYRKEFTALTEEDFDRNISINLKGPYLCSLAVGREMLKQQSGKIINIACAGGIRAWPAFIPYSISKAGVIMLTQALAKALAPHIQVNAIAPGPVLLPENYTEAEREQAVRATVLKRAGSPDDITSTILFLLEGTDYITGEVIAVDGGRVIM